MFIVIIVNGLEIFMRLASDVLILCLMKLFNFQASNAEVEVLVREDL